ncbi:MAG TPA: acyl-CoA dehydrogenase family protein [Tepidisphaeraceae bacterium]|nr:acyl-CoA dehydrogenase family protein [Tepidisphaeraceae bacterium]
MNARTPTDSFTDSLATPRDVRWDTILPLAFSSAPRSAAADVYLADPPALALFNFFERKGLAAIKEEDRGEQWYADWLAYQAEHRLYAALLSPRDYSTLGHEFDLLRVTRFLEVFGYFSPAHGYSLQVTFLGLFSILMGSNSALKREAVAALEAGGLLAFGVSEKSHGADLLANEFTLRETRPGRFVANGAKYYIGNANCASMISILARKQEGRFDGRARRATPVLFVLRPKGSPGFGNVRKIGTLGVRAAFVGEFAVKDQEVPAADVVAEGRDAWDALFGTVTLGKFFLGFGSIGICEHALDEATAHLRGRILYGRPAIEMPHLRAAMAQAYARLTGMKLYAYRALDYVHAGSAEDRRYLLFCAVQKAKVSTEGTKVIGLLSECVGAKGFESDTYFEMALRDAQLIPGLEGSTHVNFRMTAEFIGRYFSNPDAHLPAPRSLVAGEVRRGENPYLMEARTGAVNAVAFPHFLAAYKPLLAGRNVRTFARQCRAFRLFVTRNPPKSAAPDLATSIGLGQCLATIAYGQLIAENAARLRVPADLVSAVFHGLVNDLSASALSLASMAQTDSAGRTLLRRMVAVPRTTAADWESVCERLAESGPKG